jgi:hypothetical protein
MTQSPAADARPLPAIRGLVAVQNYGVSGSTFLQSLLDDHPEIVSLPGLYALPLYPFFEEHGHLPFPELVKALFARFPYWFDREFALTNDNAVGLGLHQMGPNRDAPLVVDMMEFLENFETLYGPHAALPAHARRKHFIAGVFLAYHAARPQPRPLADAVWILYPIHSLQHTYAQQMREDFAKFHIIHTVREPLRNLGSMMRLAASKSDWWMFDGLQRGLAQILNDYQMFAEIHRVNGYRPYFPTDEVPAAAIKLEDLHAYPKALMAALARWLEINWDDCLLQSTFNGMQWWNRPESKRVSGFDKEIPSHSYSEFVSARDRFILTPLLRRQYRAWGYEKPASRLALLLHLPFLLLPLSREKPDATTQKRYERWLKDRSEQPSPQNWRRWRLGEYRKCRHWLFMAWRAGLADNETIVTPLPFEKS